VLGALALRPSAVALARPQHGSLREDVTTQGVDIVVALDVSGSMAGRGLPAEEPARGREGVVAEFVGRRKSDRLGSSCSRAAA
jgi:Ca-activated chloride channel family protein